MAVPRFTITVLGSGTSVGVPMIGCRCAVCQSTDPRDNRLRPSILIRFDGHAVLVDTTPDFRQQALRASIERVDAILFTHSHADHIMGLDDVRPFNFLHKNVIPVYGSAETIAHIRASFPYIFNPHEAESSIPRLATYVLGPDAFNLFDVAFTPIRLPHGRGAVLGFRFGNAAYLTDHSGIPDESLDKLRNLDVLFLDALRARPHPTHNTLDQALKWVEILAPKRAFFTHMCHDLPHASTEATLPGNVRLAYDTLEIAV